MLAAWRSGGFAGNLEGFTDTEPGGEVPGLGALKFLGGQEGQPRGMGPAPSALITGTHPLDPFVTVCLLDHISCILDISLDSRFLFGLN